MNNTYNAILSDNIINNSIGKQYIFEGSNVLVSSLFSHSIKHKIVNNTCVLSLVVIAYRLAPRV